MTVTVALVAAPGILGDLLESVIDRDPGFQLTARSQDPTRLLEGHPSGAGLDAVIICAGTAGADDPGHLLDQGRIVVALLSADGKEARLWRAQGSTHPLRDPTPLRLLDAVRAAVG